MGEFKCLRLNLHKWMDRPLILDEATSELDSITAEKIQASINQLMQNSTSIIIAHRLSTLRNLDRLILFQNGEIIASGMHDDLLCLIISFL